MPDNPAKYDAIPDAQSECSSNPSAPVSQMCSDLRSNYSASSNGCIKKDQDAVDGDTALDMVANLIFDQLCNQEMLRQWAREFDKEQALPKLRALLMQAFGGAAWPTMRVSDSLPQTSINELSKLLHEAMRRPIPLGEDLLASATEVLTTELREDPRVMRYLDQVARAVRACQMPNSLAPKEASRDLSNSGLDDLPSRSDMSEASQGKVLGEQADISGVLSGMSIDDVTEAGISVNTLDELCLDEEAIKDAQRAWSMFISAASSRDTAGEMIYSALFESAPALQSLFTTPRAVQAMKFMNGLGSFVGSLPEPKQLKILVETLGFGHLHLDVTVPFVVLFRQAILDLFQAELADKFTSRARSAWLALLNYVGGAIIFIKGHYSERLRILQESWRLANHKGSSDTKVDNENIKSNGIDDENEHHVIKPNLEQQVEQKEGGRMNGLRSKVNRLCGRSGNQPSTAFENHNAAVQDGHQDESQNEGLSATMDMNVLLGRAVPTSYVEMFEWNASVMGLNTNGWLKEVLLCFDILVTNASNSARLQEECEVLALKISKTHTKGAVNLSEYKNCMLAALRSLLPKVWDSTYEVAWSWLWENIERVLVKNLGSPPAYEKALTRFLNSLDDSASSSMRLAIYVRFFDAAPAGQDYFKQSNTRLHFIAGRVMAMALEIYRDPWILVEEISALGLRHVGYGIPTELIPPFVTATIDEIMNLCSDPEVIEAFRWSLGLITKMLVRTINEGSTIVMKAVNANNAIALSRAVSCAPRRERATWLLNVQVGTQSISPLWWSIDTGSFEAAIAILRDLLTIRADREQYYYGMEELFERHPDIVKRLCTDAPSLLSMLMQGLVWRSRHTKNAMRRVNYYVKYLVINQEGGLSDALKSLAASSDPKIVSDPVIVLVSDTLWSGVVRRLFVLGKISFIISLVVFMLSQAVLPKANQSRRYIRILILASRLTNYSFSMGRLAYNHAKRTVQAYHRQDMIKIFGKISVPRQLTDKYILGSVVLLLLLVAMCANEPMFYCIGSASWPTETCAAAGHVQSRYTYLSMTAMFMQWFLIVDMAVFSTKMSAFVLVVGSVLMELMRFMAALTFLLLTGGSAITCLHHTKAEYSNLQNAVITLFGITLGMYEGDYREMQAEPALLLAVFIFVVFSAILLLNLLIAQLNCSYEYVYQDNVGFARLTRCSVIVDTLATCPRARWKRFVGTLRLDQPIEFDEGDVGLPGGIQVREPGTLNPVTTEMIQRFGGSCSADMPWPDDSDAQEEDHFERIERLMGLALKRVTKAQKRRKSKAKQHHSGFSSGAGEGEQSSSKRSGASSHASSVGSTAS